MSEKKEFAVGAVLHLMVGIITLLSGYAVHLWVARYLGPASYGVFGVVISLYHIIIPYLQSSFPKAASKFIAESELNIAGVFKTALKYQVIFAVILSVLLFFFSGLLSSRGFHDPSLQPYFQFLATIILPLSLYFFYFEGYLNGLRRFREEAYGKTFFTVLRTALIFIFVLLGFQVLGILWGYFISLAAVLIIFAWKCGFPEIRNRKGFSSKTILTFAAPTALSSIALMLLRNIDILLVKSLIQDNVQVGFYVAASTLAGVPYLLFSSLAVVLLPSISKAVAENDNNLGRKYLIHSIRYIFMVFVPMAAITAVTASEIVTLIYSSAYAAAGQVLSILIFSSLFLVVFMILSVAIVGSNKPFFSMLIALFGAVLLAASAHFLIPLYGLVGAAYASVISSAVSLLIAGLYVYSKFGIFFSFASLGRIILCSAVAGIIAYFWQPAGMMFLVSYALLLLFYGLLLYLFSELQQKDIRLFKDILKRFLGRT